LYLDNGEMATAMAPVNNDQGVSPEFGQFLPAATITPDIPAI